MQGHLIVAHFIDGTIVKGVSLDVNPAKPACHLKTDAGPVVEVTLAKVKALFFVKSAVGNKEHREAKTTAQGDTRLVGARLVRAVFSDTEEIVGLMNRFPPNTPFFFMLPVDPASNNIRILVNKGAVKQLVEKKL
jgi:hypothetical protein